MAAATATATTSATGTRPSESPTSGTSFRSEHVEGVGAASADGARADEAGVQPQPKRHFSASFECGFVAGLAVTAVLHPWDRALYLSVINRRTFFSQANWHRPYHALGQTLFGRAVSGGLYFPLEDWCTAATGSAVLGGQAAGVLNGFLLNPLSLVKYQSWGQEDYKSFAATSRQLLRDAGPLVVLRGVISTMMRDGIFGFCFSLRRLAPNKTGAVEQPVASDFAAAVVCAAVGTTLGSPFNYLRNLSYAQNSCVELESWQAKRAFAERAFGDLSRETREAGSFAGRLRVIVTRFNLGWGTLRVAVGMAMTDHVYTSCVRARRSVAI